MANIRTVDYRGFNYATGSGPSGFALWSGSWSLSESAANITNYEGIGAEFISDGNNFLRFRTNPQEFIVKSENFFLGGTDQFVSGAAGNIEISSSNFHLGNDGSVVMQGSITATAGGTIGGWVIGNNALSSSNNNVMLSSTGPYHISSSGFQVDTEGVMTASSGLIGGWNIGTDSLVGGNLQLFSDGRIKSSDYVSNQMGFLISAASGGFIEAENAKIRGTLSTAVFEKETVNAVGGQLYVANSTTLTGSGQLGGSTSELGFHSATDTTMSVVNVTGFTAGEILSAKRVTSTGFSTEYLLVESSSRDNGSSETDFSGKIHVQRGYGSGISGDSGSLGGSPGAAQEYSGSQVIVSTGKIVTGFIRLNANPNDQTTPYIDIVERTGSGLYDTDLKARIGDLSGVTDNINGQAVSGFGLYTDNAFLKGGIVATYGNIGGFGIDSTSISSSNDNLILRDSGEITGSKVLFNGGTIGAWNIDDSKLADVTSNIEFNASESYIRLAPSYPTGVVPPFNLVRHNRSEGNTPPTSKYNSSVLALNEPADNAFEEVIDPFGNKTIGIMAYPDSDDSNDGGYNCFVDNYDPGLGYMFVQYFKFHTSKADGSFYQGIYGYEGSDLKPIVRLYSESNTVVPAGSTTYFNKYRDYLDGFSGNTEPATNSSVFEAISGSNFYGISVSQNSTVANKIELDRWYAGITYMAPMTASYATESTFRYLEEVHKGGLFDMTTGEKIFNGKLVGSRPNIDRLRIRAYHFYNPLGDGNTKYQTMLHPALYPLDGTEPSITEVLFGSSTLLDADGTVSASNVELTGRVSARQIRNKVVRITEANQYNYVKIEKFSRTADISGASGKLSHIKLDGSMGGIETTHAIIDIDMQSSNAFDATFGGATAHNLGMITGPTTGDDENVSFTIEIEDGRTVMMFTPNDYKDPQGDGSIFINGYTGVNSTLGTAQTTQIGKSTGNDI